VFRKKGEEVSKFMREHFTAVSSEDGTGKRPLTASDRPPCMKEEFRAGGGSYTTIYWPRKRELRVEKVPNAQAKRDRGDVCAICIISASLREHTPTSLEGGTDWRGTTKRPGEVGERGKERREDCQ